jgi:hypothetical protein
VFSRRIAISVLKHHSAGASLHISVPVTCIINTRQGEKLADVLCTSVTKP